MKGYQPLSKRVQEIANMSAHHFGELFRQSTGTSPHQYVTRLRVERAKPMLLGSNASIADIASTTGFVDQSHFAKVFRRLTGFAPRAWRARS